ncbi:MAG: hypothetical protein IJH32_03130, partial [Ruminococcus sp.]|nr:hypothetical protein [Ruminococcus sp.]
MKQIKKGISLILVAAMIVSMFTIGIVSTSAAGARRLGDANNNGKVNVIDASYIQMLCAFMLPDSKNPINPNTDWAKDSDDFRACDVDKNGKINVIDASWIQMWAAHMMDDKNTGIGEPLTPLPTEPVTEPTDEPVTEPATDEPVTEPATDEPVTEPGDFTYFLVGSFNNWKEKDASYGMTLKESTGEYMIDITFDTDVEIKAMDIDGNWYPDGMDNNYALEAGHYHVYLRPDGSGDAVWHEGYLYASKQSDGTTAPETQPVTQGEDEVTYYLVGSFNDWTVKDANYTMTLKESTGEFVIDITFDTAVEIKANDSDGNWYPDGMGNNYALEAGHYHIYLKPDGSGDDVWHEGYLYASKQSDETTAPETQPETQGEDEVTY